MVTLDLKDLREEEGHLVRLAQQAIQESQDLQVHLDPKVPLVTLDLRALSEELVHEDFLDHLVKKEMLDKQDQLDLWGIPALKDQLATLAQWGHLEILDHKGLLETLALWDLLAILDLRDPLDTLDLKVSLDQGGSKANRDQ